MNDQALIQIARVLVDTGKGLLAIDESTTTCDKRFAKLGVPQTVAARRAYRELIITTAGLGEDISGIMWAVVCSVANGRRSRAWI